jgi:hypothetical protein
MTRARKEPSRESPAAVLIEGESTIARVSVFRRKSQIVLELEELTDDNEKADAGGRLERSTLTVRYLPSDCEEEEMSIDGSDLPGFLSALERLRPEIERRIKSAERAAVA